jgi:hypothetical protein
MNYDADRTVAQSKVEDALARKTGFSAVLDLKFLHRTRRKSGRNFKSTALVSP